MNKHMSGGMSSGKGMKGMATGRTNPMVSPSRANSAPTTGNQAPYANMPANNNGTFPVNLGSGVHSQFGKGVNASNGGKGADNKPKGASQPSGPRANTPANNTTNKSVSLGTTHHAAGTVPHYLRNSSNSGSN